MLFCIVKFMHFKIILLDFLSSINAKKIVLFKMLSGNRERDFPIHCFTKILLYVRAFFLLAVKMAGSTVFLVYIGTRSN